jgi:hypothetical protein
VLLSRRLDLLVWNPTAEELLGPFGAERNCARLVFGDPATRALHADWEEAAWETIAMLRFAAASYPDDEALRELIAELRLIATPRRAGGRPTTSPRSATGASATSILRSASSAFTTRRYTSATTATSC